jgi:hypothetical protein
MADGINSAFKGLNNPNIITDICTSVKKKIGSNFTPTLSKHIGC